MKNVQQAALVTGDNLQTFQNHFFPDFSFLPSSQQLLVEGTNDDVVVEKKKVVNHDISIRSSLQKNQNVIKYFNRKLN